MALCLSKTSCSCETHDSSWQGQGALTRAAAMGMEADDWLLENRAWRGKLPIWKCSLLIKLLVSATVSSHDSCLPRNEGELLLAWEMMSQPHPSLDEAPTQTQRVLGRRATQGIKLIGVCSSLHSSPIFAYPALRMRSTCDHKAGV